MSISRSFKAAAAAWSLCDLTSWNSSKDRTRRDRNSLPSSGPNETPITSNRVRSCSSNSSTMVLPSASELNGRIAQVADAGERLYPAFPSEDQVAHSLREFLRAGPIACLETEQ